MSSVAKIALVGLIGLALIGARSGGQKVSYVQADDRTPIELSQADAQVVIDNCSACHSLDYITTQPRGKGAQFWRDEVTKMTNVYKAPIAQADAAAVAAVLASKFG